MKQSLQLKLGQSLSMTPQLQQAIKLLQLSSLELQTEIQQALEANPLLEIEEEKINIDKPSDSNQEDITEINMAGSTVTDNRAEQELPDELATDSDWDDFYEHSPTAVASTTSQAPSDADQRDIYENKSEISHNLYDHLLWQLNAARLSTNDYHIALGILDGIDEKGYLQESLDDIRQSVMSEVGETIEPDEAEAVLKLVQHFDPIGIAARNPSECMLIQLKQMPSDTPSLKKAIKLVDEYLSKLAQNDFAALKRNLRVKEAELNNIIALIRLTDPHPGLQFQDSQTEYITPDVYVRKFHNQWHVTVNPDNAPQLSVNQHYASLIKRGDNSSQNTYLRDHLQEARWFIKSLQSRHDTLLKVANEIVRRQINFFEFGDEAMKPMVLKDIADELEMHESTISRITTNKYMHTPRGILEFKFFFSSHVGTADGGACSATAIRSIIKKLIAAELPKKPLSDNKIANLLDDQGIKVARRTVAKYREGLNIPPSNERKRLF